MCYSPNSAGASATHCAAPMCLDRGIGWPALGPSAYFMKSPPGQYRDDEAHRWSMPSPPSYVASHHCLSTRGPGPRPPAPVSTAEVPPGPPLLTRRFVPVTVAPRLRRRARHPVPVVPLVVEREPGAVGSRSAGVGGSSHPAILLPWAGLLGDRRRRLPGRRLRRPRARCGDLPLADGLMPGSWGADRRGRGRLVRGAATRCSTGPTQPPGRGGQLVSVAVSGRPWPRSCDACLDGAGAAAAWLVSAGSALRRRARGGRRPSRPGRPSGRAGRRPSLSTPPGSARAWCSACR